LRDACDDKHDCHFPAESNNERVRRKSEVSCHFPSIRVNFLTRFFFQFVRPTYSIAPFLRQLSYNFPWIRVNLFHIIFVKFVGQADSIGSFWPGRGSSGRLFDAIPSIPVNFLAQFFVNSGPKTTCQRFIQGNDLELARRRSHIALKLFNVYSEKVLMRKCSGHGQVTMWRLVLEAGRGWDDPERRHENLLSECGSFDERLQQIRWVRVSQKVPVEWSSHTKSSH
jgi:hypothetical protein